MKDVIEAADAPARPDPDILLPICTGREDRSLGRTDGAYVGAPCRFDAFAHPCGETRHV
jgi:hypothetical protein